MRVAPTVSPAWGRRKSKWGCGGDVGDGREEPDDGDVMLVGGLGEEISSERGEESGDCDADVEEAKVESLLSNEDADGGERCLAAKSVVDIVTTSAESS